ncbi:unnamed protein product [Camellia sinensis]
MGKRKVGDTDNDDMDEKSVREGIGSCVRLKRKIGAGGVNGSDVKRVKIWMAKSQVGDSDNDNMDEDDVDYEEEENGRGREKWATLIMTIWMRMGQREVGDNDNDDVDEDDSDGDEEEENDKSVILDNGNGSDSNKEAEGSLGSVTSWNRDGESSGGVSAESGSEGEETAIRGSSFAVESSDAGMVGSESNDAGEPALGTLGERMVRNGGVSLSEETVVSETEAFKAEKQESSGPMFGTLEGTINQPNISSIGDDGALECGTTDADVGLNSESKLVVHEETVVMSTDVLHVVKPLNFDEFNSTVELEIQRVPEGMSWTGPRFSNRYLNGQAHLRTCTGVQQGTGSPPANPPTSKLEREVEWVGEFRQTGHVPFKRSHSSMQSA